MLQAALDALRYALPKSLRRGYPDGIFGSETKAAVVKFQSENRLKPDGRAGPKTLLNLDSRLPRLPRLRKRDERWLTDGAPTGVAEPARFGLLSGQPVYAADPGAGAWNSEPQDGTVVAIYRIVSNPAVLAALGMHFGSDAAAHLRRYLDDTGLALQFDLGRMIREVASARETYENWLLQAIAYASTLGDGVWQFRQIDVDVGYNERDESQNWFYAIGGYKCWMAGVASISGGAGTLNTTYTVADRYNWDGTKETTFKVPFLSDEITVTDAQMAQFHRQGLAKEYNLVGTFARTVRLNAGSGATASNKPAGGTSR